MVQYPNDPVLIVDDEEHILTGFSAELKYNGIKNILLCRNPEKVMPLVAGHHPSMIFLDLIMPTISGQELLETLKKNYPEIPVVVVTASNETRTAVDCMKQGAYDFLSKPVEPGRLASVCRHTLEYREMRKEIDHLATTLLEQNTTVSLPFKKIITRNKKMQSIFQYIESVAPTSQPVFITGETGTGKDLIAKAIHEASGKKGEFVKINTAGLDDTMFSDTLFGHARGAYTGAETSRNGLVERAARGTLFLDEIGDLSLTSQVKLLGLIQDRCYMRIGEDKTRYTDTRIVAATNLPTEELNNRKKFRKDLYFRLMTHHIHLPALRSRKDDLELLFHHFMKKAAKETNRKKPSGQENIDIVKLLKDYPFPGNVRELEAMVFDAVSTSRKNILDIETFRRHMRAFAFEADPAADNHHSPPKKSDPSDVALFESHSKQPAAEPDRDYHSEGHGGEFKKSSTIPETHLTSSLFARAEHLPTLKTATDLLVKEAIKRTRGNQSEAARILGISRQALNKRLK
ncbi:MAG: sigma-54 dependent transcriptional regulator [Desulfobacteraceae bacterium]